MLLQTLRYADELRNYKDLRPQEYPISEREMELAQTLVKAMSSAQFDLSKYHNEYRHALEQLIETKFAGEALPVAEEQLPPVADVAEALLASIKMAGSRS
jgi:DNA end-binding protein Ku